jgi:hypothetical protein
MEEEEEVTVLLESDIFSEDQEYRYHLGVDTHAPDGCGKLNVDWWWQYAREGCRSCSCCGWVDPHYKDLDESGPTYAESRRQKRDDQLAKKHRVSADTRRYYTATGVKFGPTGGIVS